MRYIASRLVESWSKQPSCLHKIMSSIITSIPGVMLSFHFVLYSRIPSHTISYHFKQGMYHFLMSTVVHLACIVYVVLYTLHKTVCTITYCHVLSFSSGN